MNHFADRQSNFHRRKRLLATSRNETQQAQSRDAERGELIAGKWPGNLRGCADKLVRKAKNAISHQVNVEMLVG